MRLHLTVTICPLIISSLNCTMLLDMVCCLLSEWWCCNFILPQTASRVYFLCPLQFAQFIIPYLNLCNLLYLIKKTKQAHLKRRGLCFTVLVSKSTKSPANYDVRCRLALNIITYRALHKALFFRYIMLWNFASVYMTI